MRYIRVTEVDGGHYGDKVTLIVKFLNPATVTAVFINPSTYTTYAPGAKCTVETTEEFYDVTESLEEVMLQIEGGK